MIGGKMRKTTMFIAVVWLTLTITANPFLSAARQSESVVLFVTVTDDAGRLVTGLESRHFTVFENDEPRAITSFSVDEMPHSLGVALHVAGSLPNRLAGLRESLKLLVEKGKSDNEVFVVSNEPLTDAITRAQNQFLQSHRDKRALLVLTDVSDANDDALRQARVPIYFIGLNEANVFSPERQMALSELAQATGGKAVFAASSNELPLAVRPILDGQGNVDQYKATIGNTYLEGVTLRLFHPKTRQWSLYWVDNLTMELQTPLVGSFKNGRGEFFADDVYEGKKIKTRFIWSDITPNSARWEQAYSTTAAKRGKSTG
jgi:hypothetical protein